MPSISALAVELTCREVEESGPRILSNRVTRIRRFLPQATSLCESTGGDVTMISRIGTRREVRLASYRKIYNQKQIEALRGNPKIVALWECGSAATGSTDQYSDLDLHALCGRKKVGFSRSKLQRESRCYQRSRDSPSIKATSRGSHLGYALAERFSALSVLRPTKAR